MLLRTSLATLAIAAASPALADATTYWGKLGTADIVLELSTEFENADEDTVGRYFYAKNGIDVPLHVSKAENGTLVLFEEKPCTPEICEPTFDSDELPPELAGDAWTLTSDDGGHNLKGSWGDRKLAVDLGLSGSRTVDMQPPFAPLYLAGLPQTVVEGAEELSPSNFPYDYLKANSVDPASGDDITDNGVTYRYLTDPRSKFRFPQIADIGGSIENVVPPNMRLLTRRAAMTVSALDCESRAYFGMGWAPGAENWLGTYAGYPDEQVEVTYISPTVMSWSESGMLFCGGAYPEVHQYLTTIDMKTGQDLDLSKIFTDSTMGPYSWQPARA